MKKSFRVLVLFLICLCLQACSKESPQDPAARKPATINSGTTLAASVASLPDGELEGKTLFLACIGCHSLEAGADHKVGPNLSGIGGQAAGIRPGFAYSPSLTEAGANGLVWEQGTLMAWIMQAEGMVPGTWMLYANSLNPNEVKRLVDYIFEQRTEG